MDKRKIYYKYYYHILMTMIVLQNRLIGGFGLLRSLGYLIIIIFILGKDCSKKKAIFSIVAVL